MSFVELLVAKELCDTLKKASDSQHPTIRAIQVIIDMDAEALEMGEQLRAQQKASGDFNGILKNAVAANPQEPCYWLFRVSTGWLVISYLPDTAPVRTKMVYSSSKAHLKRALRKFSGKGFVDDIHFTSPDDFNWKEYRQSRKTDDSLLSQHELALREAKQAEEEARKERAMDEWRQRRRNPVLMNLQAELSAAGKVNWKERRAKEKQQQRAELSATLRRGKKAGGGAAARTAAAAAKRMSNQQQAGSGGDEPPPPPPDSDDDEDAPPPPPPDSDDELDEASLSAMSSELGELADCCARCDDVAPELIEGEFENGWVMKVCPVCLGESVPQRAKLSEARRLLDKKKAPEAEKLLLEVRLATMREHAPTHFLLALVRAAQGKTELAFSALTEALETGFDDFRTIHDLPSLKKVRAHPQFRDTLLPFVCERCKKWRAVARGTFDGQALRVCKVCVADHADFQLLENTARRCLLQKQYEAAEQWLQKMLHASPQHPPTLLLLAQCYADWSSDRSASSGSGVATGGSGLVSPRGSTGVGGIAAPTTTKGRQRAALVALEHALMFASNLDDKQRKEMIKLVSKDAQYESLRNLPHFKDTLKRWK